MPLRFRRAARAQTPFWAWPSNEAVIANTWRTRAARAIYEGAQWLDTNDTQRCAEQAAIYTGSLAGGIALLRMPDDAFVGGASRVELTGDSFVDGFNVFAGDIAMLAWPLGVSGCACLASRCAFSTVLKAVVFGARCVAWGLRENKKKPPLSSQAQRLLRMYGSLPEPPPLPHGVDAESTAVSILVRGETQATKGKQRHARPGHAKRARGASRKTYGAPPREESSQAARLPASGAPVGARGPASASASVPKALPHTVPLEKQLARARRREKAAAGAVAPTRPRGPWVTGLSCDNRVVVEQGGQLLWHSRDAYAPARLDSIRPAPYKSVHRAHRHKPDPALRAALGRALRVHQKNGLRAQDIIDLLGRHGYHTYVVGGVVRDLLVDPHHQVRDVDLVTDAPTSEVRRLVRLVLEPELPNLAVTSSRIAHYHGVVSYDHVDVASMRVRGMFEPKRFNHSTFCRVYPLSFGTYLPADAENRDLTCNAVYYDPTHDLLLDPTGYGIADARKKQLRAPSATLAMMNTTWALRYLKYFLRGYTPADTATTELMMGNARKFFVAPSFVNALKRVHEGRLDTWCTGATEALAAAGCDDLVKHIQRAVATQQIQ